MRIPRLVFASAENRNCPIGGGPVIFLPSPQEILKFLGIVLLAGALLSVAWVWRSTAADQARRSASTQARLLLSLEDANTGLLEVRGVSNEVFFSNRAAAHILGYREEDLTGRSINDILPAGFRSHHEAKVRDSMQSVANGSPKYRVSTMRCTAVTKSGGEVDIVVRVFVSQNGIIAFINKFDEMTYLSMPGGAQEPHGR